LTECTEATENTNTYEILLIKINHMDYIFVLLSVFPAGLSEAGERNVFKFLPWTILHFAIFILNFIYFFFQYSIIPFFR
ncbi:MAG: hypothetical protein MUP41_19970, partial [Desulfobacterales bacterium]|nr:hypothetical protein [Desulfobacterales bacterium]